MCVVENEDQDEASIHQLPRRVVVSQESAGAIQYSDYLFDADTVEDAADNFRETLDIEDVESGGNWWVSSQFDP